MRRLALLLFALSVICLIPSAPRAQAPGVGDLGRFYALIIGNNEYQNLGKLNTAVSDANAVAELLRTQYGFRVELQLNATREQIIGALNRLRSELSEKDNLLIFYAGHGYLDTATDTGFWLPVDAQADNEVNWIPVSEVSRNLRVISARHIIIIADSCYSGTLTRAAAVKVPSNNDAWLDRMAAKRSRTALTSGGLEPVIDGAPEGHSVFAKAVLETLQGNTDVIPGETLFARLRGAVVVKAQQTPQYSDIRNAGHDGGDFLFVPRPDIARLTQSVPSPAAATDPSLERDFWNAVKDSNDPAMFEAHIQQFPNGFLTPLARVRLKELQDKAQAQAALQVPPPAAQAAPPAGPGIEDMEEDFSVINGVIIREQPTGNSKRLGALDKGQNVLVTGRVVGANWFRVETDDGKVGYVYGPNLRKSDGLPVASGPSSQSAEARPAEAHPAQAPPPSVPEKPPERLAVVSPPPPARVPTQPAAAFKDCENCPEMVALPAGSFMMGSADGDSSEKPVHRVAVGAFALGRTVVTAKLWMACVGDGGCTYRPRTDLPENAPMNNLSWEDARHYVDWLAKTTGQPYRLPTEAEWEYAARAGTETRYWWGGQPGVAKADCKGCGGDWNTARPAPVGSFAPNPFGLYDMNGGVAQWVADCWYPTYDKAPADGSARGGSCGQHVLRGGAWKNDPSYLRSSSRVQYDADVRYITNGLRVAKTLP